MIVRPLLEGATSLHGGGLGGGEGMVTGGRPQDPSGDDGRPMAKTESPETREGGAKVE